MTTTACPTPGTTAASPPNPEQEDFDGDGAGDACDPAAPTSLTAAAVLLDAAVGPAPPRLGLLPRLTATLRSDREPVAGRTITFVGSSGAELCQAQTNAAGTASCGPQPALLSGSGYQAIWEGDPAYGPAKDAADLIRVR